MAYRPVYEETCDVNIRIAQTVDTKYLNFIVGKSRLLKKGQTLAIIQEIRSKIGSLPDYPGELTALHIPPLGCIATKVL